MFLGGRPKTNHPSSMPALSNTFCYPQNVRGAALHLKITSNFTSKKIAQRSPSTTAFCCSPARKLYLLEPKSLGSCFLGSLVRQFGILDIQSKWQIGGLRYNQKSWIGHDADWKCLSFSTKKQGMTSQPATKQISVNVPVIIEESLTISPEIQALADQLQHDGQALVDLKINNYKAAESANEVELSILLCDDKYIQKLNKQWLRKNIPTDVLSFPINEIPGLSSLLLLGDVVISLETAKQQAEERQHTLLDEVRILTVHGLLHVLGYDHERDPEAAREMEEEEQQLLSEMGWMGKGLIQASLDINEKP